MSKRPNNYVPAGRLKGWVGVVDNWKNGFLDCWIPAGQRGGPAGLVALLLLLTVPQLGVAQQLPTPPPKSSFEQFMEQDGVQIPRGIYDAVGFGLAETGGI